MILSVALLGFGSAYYHLAPDTDRLMWDRLPMAVAITALLAATLAERVSVRSGLQLLPLLITLGAGSIGSLPKRLVAALARQGEGR